MSEIGGITNYFNAYTSPFLKLDKYHSQLYNLNILAENLPIINLYNQFLYFDDTKKTG